jgi:glutathione peroxidase
VSIFGGKNRNISSLTGRDFAKGQFAKNCLRRKLMKIIFLSILIFLIPPAYAGNLGTEFIQTIEGEKMNLEKYKGQTLLVVNIATQCGYTGQLEGLEKLYQDKKSKGLVILGIPSNDFGGQTPEPEGEVKKFCSLRYGVTFPLTSKTVVKGEGKHPLIKELLAQSSDSKEIAWNFEKFLIDKNGKVVGRFASKVEPDSAQLLKAIEQIL